MTKQCIICGNSFEASGKTKMCSKECVNKREQEYQRKFLATPKGKKYAYNRLKRWRIDNRVKFLAHKQVKYAIKIGKLAKQPCGVCGKPGVAHHDDYSKPLEVQWFCQTHHMQYHQGLSPL